MLTIWQADPANITTYYDLALCRALAQAQCNVRFITSRFLYDPDVIPDSSFSTEYIYFRGLDKTWLLHYPRMRRILRAAMYGLGHRQLLKQIERYRPDVVHFQWSRLPRIDLPLMRRIKALNVPIVHTVHDIVPLFEQRLKTDYLQAIYTLVDDLIVHTEANRLELLKRYPGLSARRIDIVPHIAIDSQTQISEADQETARSVLGLPAQAPIIAFFGSIRPYKGLDLLAKAYINLRKVRPDVHLLIAGRPESAKDAEPLELLEGVPNVHLHIGFVPSRSLWQYHAAADVMIFPYRTIYQSGALITAMGFGLPVIATNVGGFPETVDGNGWLVPPENPEALASTLAEALSDMPRLREMGRRSTQLIEERHSGQHVSQKLLTIYRSLVSKR